MAYQQYGIARQNLCKKPLLNSEWVPIMDRIPPEDLMGSGGYGGSEAVRGGLGD